MLERYKKQQNINCFVVQIKGEKRLVTQSSMQFSFESMCQNAENLWLSFSKGTTLDILRMEFHENPEIYSICPNILTKLEICKERERRWLQLQMTLWLKKKPNIEKENEHSALERALQVWAWIEEKRFMGSVNKLV